MNLSIHYKQTALSQLMIDVMHSFDTARAKFSQEQLDEYAERVVGNMQFMAVVDAA